MKIRAIRVAEVGPFVRPVALEGLSGGLDVLTGPNEAGKSTLFNALSTLLTEKHTSAASKTLAPLRSDSGGAPLVEADLEIGGRLYRLRKRFLAQKSAELIDLASSTTLRGNDAENEIERLLGGKQLSALRGLVWVRQGESFDLPAAHQSLHASFAELVEREAADSAGAGRVRRLVEQVRSRLGELVTPGTGKPKAGTPYFLAIKRREDLTAAVASAKQRFDAAESRRRRREELTLDLAMYGPEAERALLEQEKRTVEAVAEAERNRERLRSADERVRARQLALESARQNLQRTAERMADVVRLAASIAASAESLRTDGEAKAAVEEERGAARSARDHAAEELELIRRRIAAARARAVSEAARRALADADHRLLRGRETSSRIEDAERALRASTITEAAVDAIAELATRVSSLEARVAASSPRAAIAYTPGTPNRIRVNGVEVADGETLDVDGATTIEIDGVGIMTLDPGAGDGAALRGERDRTREMLAAALAAHGCANVEDAKAALAHRRRIEAAIANDKSTLAALAPEGMRALEQARTAIAGSIETAPDDECEDLGLDGDSAASGTPVTVADLEKRARVLTASIAECTRHIDAAEAKSRETARRIATFEERLSAERRQLALIENELPPPDRRLALSTAQEAACASASAELSKAVLERTAFADAVPNDDAFASLLAEKERAAVAHAAFLRRRETIARDLAETEGAMQRDGEEGVATELARLEEELAEARTRAADFELDVRALRLLSERLADATRRHGDSVLRPLVRTLEPLLDRVLPGTKIVLENSLVVARIEREMRSDTMGRLSGGTREQIATLVRLAHARMLADCGTPIPLVLDDALVYADDARLELMVDILADSAAHHQVVVLSCHERAMAPLVEAHGARRLVIAPWHDPAVSAVPRSTRKGRAESPASESAA